MPDFADISIDPIGTSTNAPTVDLAPIRLFGCTVVDFNVSADWSSQNGSLTCKLIEDESNNDRLVVPVLGRPVLFELKDNSNNVLFQYIGIVDSFSRSSSNTKIYSVSMSSPLKILDATEVIMDGYAGLGSTVEGSFNLTGLSFQDFGHNNSLIDAVTPLPGVYRWHNISNLINTHAILENEDIYYRYNAGSNFGGFGFSGKSQDGIPLIKLMWALHVGINHVAPMSFENRQRAHGGNLLFGRHNYYIYDGFEAIPFYYHFDAIHFYNQIVNFLGPQYRVAGQHKKLNEIISDLCNEANVEYFSYIDLFSDPTIGNPTLQESDPYLYGPALCSWPVPDTRKFHLGGNYGGTIRIQIVNKNSFSNAARPFSNIAYNLIGLEVPDIRDGIWGIDHNRGIHPGRRPSNEKRYGIVQSFSYSDPLDSAGISDPSHGFDHPSTTKFGSKVGFESIAGIYQNFEPLASGSGGGVFPVSTEIFDWNKTSSDLPKLKNSDISIKLNDVTTMKVVTGGYQSRIVSVPGYMLRHYWGDILLPTAFDTRETINTPTDTLGLNFTSTRKIPVVTPILHPLDVDDFILIDMQSLFAQFNCPGVLKDGIYAASMLEIRCAMKSQASWKFFINKYKYKKVRNLLSCFYPNCLNDNQALQNSTQGRNSAGGIGYVEASEYLGLGNTFALAKDGDTTLVDQFFANRNEQGQTNDNATPFGLGINLPCAAALANLKKYVLSAIYEKVREIGETHYGKSWYAPVPYAQVIMDIDGNNLVGNFKRSWELTDSAYVEPSLYYPREIPQSNAFVSDGKISPFINYDHNFIIGAGQYDQSYAQEMTSLIGQNTQVFNFSEYSFDQLSISRYGSYNVVHASPASVEQTYTYLPFAYDKLYNRAALPFSDIKNGISKRFQNLKTINPMIPASAGFPGITGIPPSGDEANPNISAGAAFPPQCPGGGNELPNDQAYFTYNPFDISPSLTNESWMNAVIPQIRVLSYNDNGVYSFPFVKFTSSRVFLPVPDPRSLPSTFGFNIFTAGNLVGPCETANAFPNPSRQFLMTDTTLPDLDLFPACVTPRSFNYPQISTRYVYGPWMTSLNGIIFRGKVEYEQDDSLVPENFLIPINFGAFGNYTLSQTSGFVGMNLAAQGRANAIDNFGLFALEEGSVTVPGGPAIKRIGDSLYGVQQITDIRINISSDTIETTYSFKTVAPRFGRNNRDLERRINKMSNDIKQLKLR